MQSNASRHMMDVVGGPQANEDLSLSGAYTQTLATVVSVLTAGMLLQ